MLKLTPYTCNCGSDINRYYDTSDNGEFTSHDIVEFYWYCRDCGATLQEKYRLVETRLTMDEI